MISMEKRKWLRLWKMRVIVMFQSYCRQRQYIDTAWKIKHWYSIGDVYPGPNSKFIASNDSKIGIFMLPLIKFIVWNRLYLFGHIDRIKGIASQIQPTFTLQNAKPVHTYTCTSIDGKVPRKKSTPFVFIHRVNTKMSCHWMLHKRNIF